MSNAQLNKSTYAPGETITISGIRVKNTDYVHFSGNNGYLNNYTGTKDVNVTYSSSYVTVSSTTMSIPSDTPAGSYYISVTACDDEGNKSGIDSSTLRYTVAKTNTSVYDASEAIEYARKWNGASYGSWDHTGYNNAEYYAYTQSNGYSGNQDCANFVSQCLHAGGLPMDKTWYSDWKGSTAWINGYSLSNYLVDTLGYKGYTSSQISIDNISAGDVVYTKRSTSGSHVLIVSKVENGKVYCCAHTSNNNDTAYALSSFVYHISMD